MTFTVNLLYDPMYSHIVYMYRLYMYSQVGNDQFYLGLLAGASVKYRACNAGFPMYFNTYCPLA